MLTLCRTRFLGIISKEVVFSINCLEIKSAYLRGIDTLSGRQLCQNYFCRISEKGSILKGKNLYLGEILSIQRRPLLKGDYCAGKQTRYHKSCLPSRKRLES